MDGSVRMRKYDTHSHFTMSTDMKIGAISKSRIYQFIPSRWKLYEYSMAGLLTNVFSYDTEMAKYRVLASSPKDPIFLITPSGPNYISQLEIVEITG